MAVNRPYNVCSRTEGMGLGKLGAAGQVTDLRFKRKFRWTFQVNDICKGSSSSISSGTSSSIGEHYVKLASRPNLTIDETEINFLNGKTWIPGKAAWETITVTYYDVSTNSNTASTKALWRWLSTNYNFLDPACLSQGAVRADYAGTAVLKLYDGCGSTLETWILRDVWPQAVNFGDLDYATSDECNIELTLRYSDVSYQPGCGVELEKPCCTPCQA